MNDARPFHRLLASALCTGLLAFALLFLTRCKNGPDIEICYDHPKFGQVCAVRVKGQWLIRTTLDPDAAKEVLQWIKEQNR